jgi:orotidine-5'-phosphate decarboxylase
MEPLLFVALDNLTKDPQDTLKTANWLDKEVEGNFGFKVNLDYLLRRGVVSAMNGFGSRPFFADTKTWNGKRTMADVAKMMVDAGVDYFNVWTMADDQLEGAIKATEGSNTKVLGLTVLTHYTEAYCQKWFRRSLDEIVRFMTEQAKGFGCHGVVLPGTCLPAVSDIDIIKVVPGIRMDGFADDRHKQEVTPGFAVNNGAKIIVCGSPIMKVVEKANALRHVLSMM